jgi:hypothetical protein
MTVLSAGVQNDDLRCGVQTLSIAISYRLSAIGYQRRSG